MLVQGIEGGGQVLLAAVYRDFGALCTLLPAWLTKASKARDLWTFQVGCACVARVGSW